MKSILKVAVIGGGTMGLDIAALLARQGMPVTVKEITTATADTAQKKFSGRVESWLTREKITDMQASQMLALFSATTDYESIKDADLAIEAIFENREIKQRVFAELEAHLAENAILASNTSSIPIALLASGAMHPERFAGFHFFNPPTRMPLIEVIPAAGTAADTVESLRVFAIETLQKTPITVKDRPGFLVNVLLCAYLVPAIRAMERTTVLPEQIDACARAFGWPMGPFFLLDMLGIDVAAEVLRILCEAYGERFADSGLVSRMVQSGRLGNKAGKGFYGENGFEELRQEIFPNRVPGDADAVFKAMMFALVDEASLAIQDDIASAEDIETGCLLGLGFPQKKGGPLHYADEVGVAGIVQSLGEDASLLLKSKAAKGETFFESW